MEQMQDYTIMLEQVNSPAFLVQNDVIVAANRGAKQYMVEIGTPIASILTSGQEEYPLFQKGSMYLTICLCGTEHSCCVTQLQDCQVFTIDENSPHAQLQVLALAAQHLSMPISEISLLLDQLSGISNADKAKISQNLYKLQRMIGNMSDAGQYRSHTPQMVTYEICAIFEEILEKSKTLLSQRNITLNYELPAQPIYSLADPEMLKRAAYNLISNAAKFTPAGAQIHIALKQYDKRLHLTVTNGLAAHKEESASMFNRYTRQPGLEDPKFGLGLGMSLVHAAAVAHGGTVLAEQTENQSLKITMTLAIRKSKDSNVRSNILIPDLYGGQDQALIELSDVLPYQLYMD